MQREAFWESRESGSFNRKQKETAGAEYEDVIMSLGSSLDSLQESYHEKEQLSESYMLEALASELLLMGYGAYNRYVRGKRNWPELLKGFQYQITCNTAFCIIPKKSVVFVAELTRDEQIQCESICAGCRNVQCPNRVERDFPKGGMLARVADMSLNYGYSRIFGKL